MKKKRIHNIFTSFRRKPIFALAAVFALSFLLFLVWGVTNFYLSKDKTYKNLYMAQSYAGNLSADELVGQINSLLYETKVEIAYNQQKEIRSPSELGITVDEEWLKDMAENKSFKDAFRPWFVKTDSKLHLNVDKAKLSKVIREFDSKDFKPPKDAEFKVIDNKLVIQKQKDGFGLDAQKIGEELADRLSATLSMFSIQVGLQTIEPDITEEDINNLAAQIESRLDNQYSITAKGTVVEAKKSDIAGWLDIVKEKDKPAGLEPNYKNVKDYVEAQSNKFSINPINQVTSVYKSGKKSVVTTKGKNGVTVINKDSITKDIIDKLKSGESYKGEFVLAEVGFRKIQTAVDDTVHKAAYTYDVVVWGPVKSDLSTFKSLAAQTYADGRGWSSGGVSFSQVASGGNFTLVLATPARVASASSTCSSFYSCRVGRYVIINDDRWRLATPSWNNASGSLRNYRHMVVNHETGHWLGFSHRFCAGSGQLAPVMQQQSISLQGCKFNPWPTVAEISSL